jgi:hypothetical protein
MLAARLITDMHYLTNQHADGRAPRHTQANLLELRRAKLDPFNKTPNFRSAGMTTALAAWIA